MRDPVDEFKAYNRRQALRNPELMRYKIARMAEGPFPFFRGTFHLFAKDVLGLIADAVPLLIGAGAELDLVGDIHSENYGTYESEHRQIHYDINDFDETTRGRFGLDVCRLAISHFLAMLERHETLERAVMLTLSGLRAYVEAVRRLLKKGKDINLDISDTQPCGVPAVDDLVRAMAAVKRPAFINRISVWEKGRRHLIRTADHFNLPDDRREQALRLLADYRQRCTHHDDRDGFYNAEDVCGRVSGIGSMGRLRYIVLVTGKGSAEARNVLLEFKESLPSAYDTGRGRETDADALLKRAERVITVQNQSQAANDPYAGWAIDGGQSFQVRQRGPHDDRLKFARLDADAVEGAMRIQASILARAHARSAAHAVGPTNPIAELQDADAFCQRVLGFALDYADLVRRDWQRFVGARPELEHVESWAGSQAMGITVTYLQMFARPERVVPPPRDGLAVLHAKHPTTSYYRYLYDAVGRDWNWMSRKRLADAALAAIIHDPRNEVHVLHIEGVPAGFAELDRRRAGEIELVQFGLVPEFIGQGLGRYFIHWTVERAWSYGPQRLWLHTCTEDHPAAIPNYLKAGFQVYKAETR